MLRKQESLPVGSPVIKQLLKYITKTRMKHVGTLSFSHSEQHKAGSEQTQEKRHKKTAVFQVWC